MCDTQIYDTLRDTCAIPPPPSHKNKHKSALGWHVCRTKLARKMFFEARISHEKCTEIFPNFSSLYFAGPQNSRQKSHQIFLQKIKKKVHRRASAGAQGEQKCVVLTGIGVGPLSISRPFLSKYLAKVYICIRDSTFLVCPKLCPL